MEVEIPYIDALEDDDECIALLIQMTNEYIDYRNQIFDSTCIQSSMEIDNEEDFHYVSEMDRKISEVLAFLDDV